ncbi:MAG: phage tail tape measure protein [Zoogloeaceae bacterium]|jgi:TP901 family phage tail tape measure protein|nr:phage tail tape measure protein [Zoogloeaceae bacterium]
MADNLSIALKINVDAASGKSNLDAFTRQARASLESIGKSKVEIKAIEDIARKVREGKTALASLNPEYQKLIADFNKGFAFNQSRDFLGLRSHSAIQADIQKVRNAYAQMKASGEATFPERWQAAFRMTTEINRLKEETNGWATALGNAKVALASLAVSAAGIAKMTQVAIDFEAGMTGVAKVVDGTDAQIAGLAESLKNMAQSMPVEGGLGGLTQMAQAGGQMGIPIEDMEQFIRLTAEMSAAFKMTSEEAGNVVARMMNVYGVPLAEIEALGDAINGLGNTMATNERAIVETMTRIGGSARNFGLTEREAAALSATMNALGMSPRVAATSLGGLLERLQTVGSLSEDAQDALARLGLTARQLAADIREKPQEALLSFLTSLKSLDGAARTDILTKIFGREHAPEIARLTQGLDQYRAALTKIQTVEAGSMHAEFLRQMESADNKIKILKQNVEVLAESMGALFLPIVKVMIDAGTSIAQVFNGIATNLPSVAMFSTLMLTLLVSSKALTLVFRTFGVMAGQILIGLKARAAALSASMTAASAATGAAAKSMAVLRGVMGFLGGPVGVVLTLLMAGVTAFSAFGREGKAAADEIKSHLEDLEKPIEDVRQAFLKLSDAQRQGELTERQKELDDLSKSYRKQAAELERLGAKGANYTGKIAEDARNAFRVVLEESRKVGTKVPADWDNAANAVAGAGGMVKSTRDRLIGLIDKAQESQQSVRGLSGVVQELKSAMLDAAGGVGTLNTALSEGTVDARKYIDGIKRQLANLKDPSALGELTRDKIPTWVDPDQKDVEEAIRLARELDAFNARRRTGGGGTKRDPIAEANLSKTRDLTRQLVEAEQQRAKAEAGVFESTTKARDALENWLKTDENALKLSAQQKAALFAHADAVDTVTASLKKLTDANKRQKDIAAAMPAITLELAKMQGEDTAAREIAARYKDIHDKLQAEIDAGSLTAQADLNIVVQLQGLEEQKAKLDGVLADVEKIRTLQSQEEQSISTGREVGTLTEVEAQEKLLNLHQRIGAELLKQKPLLEALAKVPGAVGEQARAALAALDDQMKRLQATTTLFETTIKNGLTSGLQSAIQGLADGTMTLREAIHELASTVAESLIKMYADNAIQYFMRDGGPLAGLFASANQGANGAGGLLGALFGNGVQQTAEGQASGALTAASGQLSTASGQFQAAVAQFQSAIATLTGSATTLTSAGATQTTAAGMQTTAAGLQTTAAGMETTAASLQSTAGGSLSAAATQQMAAAGALQGAAATGASSGGGIGGLFGGIMSLFGFAEGGTLPGHSVSDTSDNTLYWGTPGEFVTRRKVVRQPGTRAFLEVLNRYGLASAARFAKSLALPGFADGGHVPAAPAANDPMRHIAANWTPQAANVSTSVDNRLAFYMVDDPKRINEAMRSPGGEKAIEIMLSRNPQKFRQILGV